MHKIDLICSGTNVGHAWNKGEHVYLPAYTDGGLSAVLTDVVKQSKAEWILLWHYNLGSPDSALIESLCTKPCDAWHAGLRRGLQGKPDVLNYILPTWMYNKDASPEIEHTSFRLTIDAALIRTSVLRQVLQLAAYESKEMFGLALGYKILRSGGIIRYHPGLLKHNIDAPAIPTKDEWLFAKEFFPLKWQVWALMNKPGLLKNIPAWFSARADRAENLKPKLRPSKKVATGVIGSTVSVLAPTLNRYSYLAAELEQLSLQTVLPCEVLITDQTDEKDRVQVDVSKYPALTIRYFPQDEKGQCIAWNKLLEEAKGEFVLFLGDDADDIRPDFIEQLLQSLQMFNADMVAANVIEAGIKYGQLNEHYYLSDTFPIALARKKTLEQAGFFDMFFNKNIRADHDIAMRCHLNGALMIFNPSATIFHHRAPVGGLRTHNARSVTSNMVKNSVNKFLNPTTSEIYLARKYYSPLQVRNYIKIKYLNQLFVRGSVFRKLLRFFFFLVRIPSFMQSYKQSESIAIKELKKAAPAEHLNTPVS